MAGSCDVPSLLPAAAASWLNRVSAPPQWRVVDFISDLHLHAGDAATFAAWQNYLLATTAQAVFILGDLFEVWVGDDLLDSDTGPGQVDDDFARACANALQQAGTRHAQFFMCGNRDFLIGDAMLRRCAMQGLADPCVLEFAGAHWLLSHGDALVPAGHRVPAVPTHGARCAMAERVPGATAGAAPGHRATDCARKVPATSARIRWRPPSILRRPWPGCTMPMPAH